MSLTSLCRLLTVLSDIALHQKLSSADVPTFHLSLLQPSFQYVKLWNTLKHKDVAHRLWLVFAVGHTETLLSLSLLVSQMGFGRCASHHLPVTCLSRQARAAWGDVRGRPCFPPPWLGRRSVPHSKRFGRKNWLSGLLSDTGVRVVVGQGYFAWWSEEFRLVWQLLVAFTEWSGIGSFLHWIHFVKYIRIGSLRCNALVQRMKGGSGE